MLLTSKRLHSIPLVTGLLLMVPGWWLLWTLNTLWNPIFFFLMWTGASLVLWALSSGGYPGVRRHSALLLISIPVWWWFEFVNGWVGNWEYVVEDIYTPLQHMVMSSIAYSTVLPALDASFKLFLEGKLTTPSRTNISNSNHVLWAQICMGMVCQSCVFVWPSFCYPLVWVSPFLIVDGIIGMMGGQTITQSLISRNLALPVLVAGGALLCGILWEFWNYWAAPKWVYHIPYLDFFHIFEMPILGYGGYVPFGWSMYQLLCLTKLVPMHINHTESC